MQRKLKKIEKKFDNVRFCVRTLCEQQPLAALDANGIRHHHSGRHGDLSAPLHRFFSRGRIKASKEVKNITSRGILRVMPMGRLSVLSIHASRRERDVTYETCSLSHFVFSTAFN